MILLNEKKECCGCGVCAESCPARCIRMEEDAEGFLYPAVQADACTGCGQCVRRCPLNNITLQTGKPVWGQNCTHCMACICYCPTEAIEYGKKSLGKPRYHFEAL